uniref:Olfactory receptor n=1 Tax=Melopsittacus undulatus TaxID=13146 RepID=A0A8V5GI77_MELUD
RGKKQVGGKCPQKHEGSTLHCESTTFLSAHTQSTIQPMAQSNCTQVTQFILVGFTEEPVTQGNLFLLFLLTYLVTIVGNLGIIILIRASPHLHSPMYYFLGNLAFVDLCSSTIITPKMLVDLMLEKKSIAYAGCVAQVFLFDLFGITECFLLASMAYDRYVAICHPLLYPLVMSPKCCFQLVTGSYLMGLTNGVRHTIGIVFGGSFCGPNRIDHFFCDAVPVLKLVCSDTHSSEMVIFAFVTINVVGASVVILLSYISILRTVLRMCSAQSRARAFHTCASHLMAVSMYFGPAFFMYLQPSSRHRSLDKVASIFYAMVTPMLNPFIYSLRNKEVKGALLKSGRMLFRHWQHARLVSSRT